MNVNLVLCSVKFSVFVTEADNCYGSWKCYSRKLITQNAKHFLSLNEASLEYKNTRLTLSEFQGNISSMDGVTAERLDPSSSTVPQERSFAMLREQGAVAHCCCPGRVE
jgi:hypothetical protein